MAALRFLGKLLLLALLGLVVCNVLRPLALPWRWALPAAAGALLVLHVLLLMVYQPRLRFYERPGRQRLGILFFGALHKLAEPTRLPPLSDAEPVDFVSPARPVRQPEAVQAAPMDDPQASQPEPQAIEPNPAPAIGAAGAHPVP